MNKYLVFFFNAYTFFINMSLSKLHKSGIITGHVDHFCFACDGHFESEEDAHAHTAMAEHQKNMETIAYFEKFAGENIRKVKCGYFCEHCNIFLKTSTKVAMHVQEMEHVNNKGYSQIKRQDGSVLVNDQVVEEKAWHSMTDDVCALCNTDYDDEGSHKKLPSHIINLVGSKLEFGPNGIVYRRVDSASIQCLTCNIVCALNLLEQHSESVAHKETIQKCLYQSPKNGENISDTTNESNTVETKTKVLEFVPRFQKNDINVNFLTETAFCKKCNETFQLDRSVIEEHISQHNGKNNGTSYPTDFDNKSHELYSKAKDNKANVGKDSANVDEDSANVDKDSAKVDKDSANVKAGTSSDTTETGTSDKSAEAKEANADLINFSKENHLTFNLSESNAYCRVCKVKIPSAMKSLSEHVNGRIHQKNVAYMSKSLEVVPKIPFDTFVKSDIGFTGLFHDDVVVNYKYCLPIASFHGLTTIEDFLGLRCNLCNVTLPLLNIKQHTHEESHREALRNTAVVTCLQDEFVREFRPGMYHCGYCNTLFQNWTEVQNHLSTSDHEECKSEAKKRVRIHMRELARFREQRRAEMFCLALMRHRFG
ncbi:hypothetical protein K1T71_013482 [Dendrolimus kikuchii]|uniref:Uncharacterized protein n=1 Tax=Dendrolimus kikuchii TaxID=765133 RepID=A0ACC1CGS1_9NEOP|nr:hypothetical protein K1T71_013482 [Dendrolimus kikuchii]